MVSLIQESLGEAFFGSFTGRFIYTELGGDIRKDTKVTACLITNFMDEINIVSIKRFGTLTYLGT